VNQVGWSTTLAPSDYLSDESFVYQREVWEPGILDVVPSLTPKKLVSDATKIADLLAIGISLYKPK
jgi:hypothetical protein